MLRCAWVILLLSVPVAANAADSDFAKDVAPIFTKYCTACHNAEDKEGKLDLESYAALVKGGEKGAVITPESGKDSRLVRMLTGEAKPQMPPEEHERPTADEIDRIKSWIDAGAKGPAGAATDPAPLVVPKIEPRKDGASGMTAFAGAGHGAIAIARGKDVEAYRWDGKNELSQKTTLKDHAGPINSISFVDEDRLVTASGEPGLFGEARLWNMRSDPARQLVATFRGHRDALYAAKLSPDGTRLATGGYDQKVIIWDYETKKPLHTLAGHSGAVFDLDFSPNGNLLATASADRTVKIWDVNSGQRLDTLGQPLKDVHSVAFSPDGKTLAAGGADRRIRVWAITAGGREGTNVLIHSRFAHDGAVLRLHYLDNDRLISAAENRTIKVWAAATMTLNQTLETQPEWIAGIAPRMKSGVGPKDDMLMVGRVDGSFGKYVIEPLKPFDRQSEQRDASPDASAKDMAAAAPPPSNEIEPNDAAAQAQPLDLSTAAVSVTAKIQNPADVDLYRIQARANQSLILETTAAREKSAADTRIEILDPAGKPVPRMKLQAVRDSAVTFRPADANQTGFRITNWEEMELNQYMYVGGEVCRLFRFPQGPDSDFVFYESAGRRRAYFDTTATAHYLDEPCYIVAPLPPSAEPFPTGLPTFSIPYENDDASDRKLGTDSRLTFTAPADGEYLVRVTDTRGAGGEKFTYRLTIRPPRPDFILSLSDRNPTIPAASGKRFVVRADRIDGFEGPIHVEISNPPPGFTITSPLVIEADQTEARGVLVAAPDAAAPAKDLAGKTKVTATATIGDRPVTKTIEGFGEIKLAPKPKLLVRLEVDNANLVSTTATAPVAPEPGDQTIPEVVIAPGTTVTARLAIERNGFTGEVKFDVDNLPHGIIVDNIGLSGILITADKSERQLFLTARDWVPEQERLFQAVSQVEGNQASAPMRIIVRKKK